MPLDPQLVSASEQYLDRLFGPGSGAAHSAFLERLGNPGLIEALHRAHVRQADESQITIEENYLLGMCVLCATRGFGPAGMFAKTLRHLGVKREKILEAIGRLSSWIGPVPAAEAAGHIGKAIDEFDRDGLGSMKLWFPKGAG